MYVDTLWQSADSLERSNKEALNEIESYSKLCSDLHLSCHEEDGKLGIWWDDNETHYLLDPVNLFNSIFEDSGRLYVHTIVEEGLMKDITFHIDVIKEDCIYNWTLLHTDKPSVHRNCYRLDSYIETIRRVITQFEKSWNSGRQIAYDERDINSEAIEACVKQLAVKAVFPRYYVLRADEVKVERFIFTARGQEGYTIGIGDRIYSTFCTFWDSDMEYIRHQFEEYAYGNTAHIRLSYDMSETEIFLKKASILDTVTDAGGGHSYKYKECIRVKIISNEFAGMPTLVGYCEEKQVLTELYEGLLEFALEQPGKGHTDSNEPCDLAAYNQLKSPIIESRLKEEHKRDFTNAENRQTRIIDILTINPDFDYFVSSLDSTVDEYDDLEELLGFAPCIDGLKEWAEEIVPIVVKSESGERYTKDWEDYHRRGLEFAKKLRAILPERFDLWYEAPFEDNSGTIDKPHLII